MKIFHCVCCHYIFCLYIFRVYCLSLYIDVFSEQAKLFICSCDYVYCLLLSRSWIIQNWIYWQGIMMSFPWCWAFFYLQEIVYIYPVLSPPNLTPAQSNRVCNALALLQVKCFPLILVCQYCMDFIFHFLWADKCNMSFKYWFLSWIVQLRWWSTFDLIKCQCT